jgi:hypothetical protein
MTDDDRELRRINDAWTRLHGPQRPSWLYDPTFIVSGLIIVIVLGLTGYLLQRLGFIR